MSRMVYVYNFYVFSLILLSSKGYSVPIDYCLHPFNRSDCNMTPTPVFSYYKPGSRCEIEFWRGCPTLNKFPSEALCSHYCIGKLYKPHYTDENTVLPAKIEDHSPQDPCQRELNTTQCNQQETKVYTFYNNSCVKATWRGCETENKFEDEKSCKETCSVEDDLEHWKQQLQLLLLEEVKEIDNIIDIIETELTTKAPETKSQNDLTTESTSEIATMETTATTEPITTSTTVPTTSKTTTTTDLPTTTSEAPKPTTTVTTTTTTEITTPSTTTTMLTTTTTQTTTTESPGDAEEVITT